MFISNNIDLEAAHKQYDERNSGVKVVTFQEWEKQKVMIMLIA